MSSTGLEGARYEQLIAAAATAPFEGWDFSWLRGRLVGEKSSWDYLSRARELISHAQHVVDVDTGGGEVLASLNPPSGSVATESWPPNVSVARRHLEPLNVSVVAAQSGAPLPLPDESADVLLNRHGSLVAAEVARILVSGGRLLTQQVGSQEGLEINAALGVALPREARGWTLAVATNQLEAAGLKVVDAREQYLEQRVLDIGALVFHLRAIEWQVPEFTVERFDAELREIDRIIRREGAFLFHAHRFLIEARRPRPPLHP